MKGSRGDREALVLSPQAKAPRRTLPLGVCNARSSSVDERCDRRTWLLHAVVMPGATLVALGACEQRFSCADVTGLTVEQIQVRARLAYVDLSSVVGATCDNCQQYIEPAAGAQCGTCKVMPGPAHPRGYCKVWVKVV